MLRLDQLSALQSGGSSEATTPSQFPFSAVVKMVGAVSLLLIPFFITFDMLKYCLVIYSLLYLNVVIRISFYIRLQFYFEDQKWHVLSYSAIIHGFCSTQPVLEKRQVGQSSYVCLDAFAVLVIAFLQGINWKHEGYVVHLCLPSQYQQSLYFASWRKKKPSIPAKPYPPILGEGHRLGRLKRPFSKNKQREIWPSVLIWDEQMVFGIVIVTAEYHYVLSPPKREIEHHHLSTRRFCSWSGTMSRETSSEPSLQLF